MDRYNKAGGNAAAPVAPAAPVDKFFSEGNPGGGIPATKPGPWWFHMMSEELRNVIVAAGLTPDHANTNQLSLAIAAIVSSSNRAVILEGAVFEASVSNGEAVYWDAGNNRFDEAIADGTSKQNCVGFADVTNSKVYAFGDTALLSGLTPGAKYYLSTSAAGAITAVQPSTNIVTVGIAKSATTVFVDIDQSLAISTLPRGYKYGLDLVNNAVDLNNDIDFSSGVARDAGNSINITLAAALTKRLDAAWVTGNNNGGLFSGAKAINTWYHSFVIINTNTGVVDCGFDTSIIAANRPANNLYRRVGSVLTDASGNIVQFIQNKDEFWYKTPRNDLDASVTTTRQNFVISVPTGLDVIAFLNVYGNGADRNFYVSSPNLDDVAAAGMPTGYPNVQQINGISDTGVGNTFDVITNNAAQVSVRQSGAASIFTIQTRGYRDVF